MEHPAKDPKWIEAYLGEYLLVDLPEDEHVREALRRMCESVQGGQLVCSTFSPDILYVLKRWPRHKNGSSGSFLIHHEDAVTYNNIRPDQTRESFGIPRSLKPAHIIYIRPFARPDWWVAQNVRHLLFEQREDKHG